MKIQIPLNGKVQLAFGSAIFVLLAVGMVSIFGMAASVESKKWVRHTLLVLEELQDLTSSMQTIEDDYRGFVITGDEIYLRSYREATMDIEQDEASIRVLTADNPVQQNRLPSLEKFAAQKMQFGESVIGLRRDRGLDSAMDAIRTGSGRFAMDGFESIVRNMRVEELRLLSMRESEEERRVAKTKTNLLLGTILGLAVVGAAGWSALRDSSKRAAAAGALQEQKEKYRSLLEAAPDAIVIANAQGRIVLVSAATERLFGYRSDEVVGQIVEMLVPMLFRAVNRQRRLGNGAALYERFMDEGLELYGLRKDKTEFPAEITLSQFESPEGSLLTAAIRDISSRRDARMRLIKTAEELADANRELVKEMGVRQQVEAELSSSHAEAERLLSSISSILIGVDGRGWITRWNAAAAATFDLPSEAALGRPFEDLGIRWQTPEVITNILSIAALGESIRLNELDFRDQADQTRCLGVTIHPIRGEHNQYRGFVFLGVEISQRKQLQEQLRLAQKLEAIGQLAAGVAHEINTPTQFVGDNIHFLQESWNKVNPLLTLIVRLAQPDEVNSLSPQLAAELHAAAEAEIDYLVQEVPKALAQSLDGVERVSQIVKAMREFSHPGGLEKQSADLNRAIQAAITVSRNEWKYVAEVQADLDSELPLVECVIGQIQQVVLNLLINAAHAIQEKIGPESQEKGIIHVTTRVVVDMVEIRVEDTGTGIPQELHTRVFEPFFTTKRVGKGTGQGLALVHSLIVKGHSGKIWIESPPGKGATFVIQLPMENAWGTGNVALAQESAWNQE